MKVLQLCNKVPFPPQDGGCIAMNNITQGLLQEGCVVKVLAINTEKHFVDISSLPLEYREKTRIEAVMVDTKVKPVPAFFNIIGSGSYNVSRFYSMEFEKKLIEVLKNETFDVVQLESIYVSVYIDAIRKHSKAKIVLRAHNVEYKIAERNALTNPVAWKRFYYKFLAKRLKEYELGILGKYDAVAAITAEDASWFKENKFKGNLSVFPFGINLRDIDTMAESDPEASSVFHIGAMDWQPNVDGVNWLLNNVWNRVIEKQPQARLYLAGRKMPDELKQLNLANVTISGEVPDAHQFMISKGLMLVPLLSGGGMRVKIIEGMALGKVIVTTPVGAEGIECKSGENIIIVKDANDFVEAIDDYLSNPSKYLFIGKNAKAFALRQYNNTDICKRLIELYKSL